MNKFITNKHGVKIPIHVVHLFVDHDVLPTLGIVQDGTQCPCSIQANYDAYAQHCEQVLGKELLTEVIVSEASISELESKGYYRRFTSYVDAMNCTLLHTNPLTNTGKAIFIPQNPEYADKKEVMVVSCSPENKGLVFDSFSKDDLNQMLGLLKQE